VVEELGLMTVGVVLVEAAAGLVVAGAGSMVLAPHPISARSQIIEKMIAETRDTIKSSTDERFLLLCYSWSFRPLLH
jgi:hypothetical protein